MFSRFELASCALQRSPAAPIDSVDRAEMRLFMRCHALHVNVAYAIVQCSPLALHDFKFAVFSTLRSKVEDWTRALVRQGYRLTQNQEIAEQLHVSHRRPSLSPRCGHDRSTMDGQTSLPSPLTHALSHLYSITLHGTRILDPMSAMVVCTRWSSTTSREELIVSVRASRSRLPLLPSLFDRAAFEI